MTEGRDSAHLALKITALISTDILTRMSQAQKIFLEDILQFDKRESITKDDLAMSLMERGIQFDDKELSNFFNQLRFSDNKSDTLSRLEVFVNGHLFQLLENKRSDLHRKIAIGCGTGLTQNDLDIFDKMS